MVRGLAAGALLIGLLPALLAASQPAASAAAPAAIAPGEYGVNQDLEWDPPEQVGPEIQLMKSAGVEWLRLPLRWQWLEPARDSYHWDRLDDVVDRASGAGLKILAVLGGTPAWSSGVDAGSLPNGVHLDAFAPARDGDFADYVSHVVEHFRGRVQAYELFNEPNSPNHWQPSPDAARFIELLCAGYRAARAADPQSVIVAGGLNGNGLSQGPGTAAARNFLKAIDAGEGRRCADVLAIHPFVHPTEMGLGGLQAWVDETRRYMRAAGDTRELWLTEVGWSTGLRQWGHATISEEEQAAWVQAVYVHLDGVQKIFWYNFKEVRPHPTDAEFQWGWLRYGLEPKAAYSSFAKIPK